MLKRYTDKFNADIYLNAAKKLNLKFKIFDKRTGFCRIWDESNELYLKNTTISRNDMVAMSLSLDKYLSSKILAEKNIPVPKQYLFSSDDYPYKKINLQDVLIAAKKLNSAVIKPRSAAGGRGVFVNLKTDKDVLESAKKILRMKYEDIIVEEFISGRDYRILLFECEIIAAVERIRPTIKGNNKDTIKKLIGNKNLTREEMELDPILIDDRLKSNLEKLNLSLQSVLPNSRTIVLRNNSNLSEGGETKWVDIKEIHPDNKKMFIKAAQISNLGLCAVDYISKDISKSYKENHGVINEINGSPGIKGMYYAQEKPNLLVAEKILQLYFKL